MTSFRVETDLPLRLASGFGGLVAVFDSLQLALPDLSDAGDSRLTQAIEQFIDRSREGISELSDQFGQLQRLLTATAQGYEGAETHLTSEIQASLSSAPRSKDGS